MAGAADYLAPALALFGGGALGAALGGVLLFGTQWSGARLRGSIGAAAGFGAMLGLVATYGVPTPGLAFHLPRLLPPSDAEEMERVLKTYYPDDYAAAQSTMLTLKATGASDQQVRDAERKIALPLLQRQMPLASTENALAYLDIAKDEQQALSADPDLCYRVLIAPSPEAMDELPQKLPADLKAREAHLMVQLLEQTATHPQPAKMTDDLDGKLKIWIRDAYWGLSFDERDALQGGGSLQSKAGCDMVGNFLRPLDLMGGTDAAEAYKALSEKGLQSFNG
jgi:hypothetical protein